MKRTLGLLLCVLLLCACGQKAGAAWQEQYDLGVRYLSEGNYQEAILAFTAAIEIDPQRPEAYVGRGDAYLASGDSEDNLSAAQADYEAALDLDDTLSGAWLGLSQVYVGRGDPQRAQEILEEAAEKTDDPDIRDRLEELREESSGEGSEDQETPRRTDSAPYEIQRQDLSYYDGEGQVLIELYYDQVVLTDEAFGDINSAIRGDYLEKFPDGQAEYEAFLSDPYLSPEYPYMNTYTAQVTHNGDGIFSISLSQSWYMGGVFNGNVYGLTYDLNTGEPASLPALMGMDEAALTQQLKSVTKAYMDGHPGLWFDEAWDTVDSLALGDFEYYIQDGELVLCFETYLLGPGATGCLVLPTGMAIQPGQGQQSQGQSASDLVSQVVMDHRENGNREYAVFQGISSSGLVLWLYETDRYELAQLQRVSGLGIWGDLYCLVEGGTVVALDLRTGQVRWKNDEFVGGNPAVTWDENYLYLCGYLGPDLFVVSRAGRTMARADSLDPDYMWPMDISLEGGQVVISYEGSMTDGYGGPYRLKVNPATLETSRA